MKTVTYSINQNKRKFVLDWFISLRNSKHITWPICRMTNKQWYALFKTMNPDHIALFPDVKYFSLQVNSIIDQCGFINLTKKVFKHPLYNVEYTLKDLDYIDQILDNVENEEVYYFGKIMNKFDMHLQLYHNKYSHAIYLLHSKLPLQQHCHF